jgi:hypothetical protein
VFWDDVHIRYRAQIGYKRRKHFLGYFSCPELAARAYDRKAVELRGTKGE